MRQAEQVHDRDATLDLHYNFGDHIFIIDSTYT